jgi:hypothetical protein
MRFRKQQLALRKRRKVAWRCVVPVDRHAFHERRSGPPQLGAHCGTCGIQWDFALRCFAQRHNRQLLAAHMEADAHRESSAALPLHAGLRFGARRTARQSGTSLQPRPAGIGFRRTVHSASRVGT